MALSEIEKLERRYAENPQGLTFAPLAEVHRKNGDTARALDLLRPGLELHPDYIPASIVLGRCHLDLGDLPAAETAFTHVLELDNENVIALKALADINERLHHFDRAESWLRQLLVLDRSNDEARAQLERIETARAQASEVAVRSSLAEEPIEVQEVQEVQMEPPETAAAEPVLEERLEEIPLAEAPAEPTPISIEEPSPAPLDLEEVEFSAVAPDSAAPLPPGLEIEDFRLTSATRDEEIEPLPGLVGRDVDQVDEGEWAVETSEDIVLRSEGGGEFQVPDASQELFSGKHMPEPSPFGESRPVETPPEPVEEPAPQAFESAAEPVPDLVVQAEPHTVVTETMAEVLHQQGHAEDALRVYRELEERGADERVRRRIAELEGTGEPARREEPVQREEPAKREEPVEPPAPARQRFAASDTSGESVAAFFGKLLAARLPGGQEPPAPSPAAPPEAEADAGGAPTRPAADALSLSSVFGEESATVPPAVPAQGSPAGGVSFDEFYSSSSSAGGARNPRSPEGKNDDLDQFHAWLQNLKR
jgi:tetratricopeptide (TPR) repeat protein